MEVTISNDLIQFTLLIYHVSQLPLSLKGYGKKSSGWLKRKVDFRKFLDLREVNRTLISNFAF